MMLVHPDLFLIVTEGCYWYRQEQCVFFGGYNAGISPTIDRCDATWHGWAAPLDIHGGVPLFSVVQG